MSRKTLIFDLDGTLLNTIDDLADAVNYALSQFHLPTHPTSAIRQMVGNGVRLLVERAIGDAAVTDREAVFACFKTYYVSHCQVKTRLYDGLREVLLTLRERGYRMAIVSNKLQAGVSALQEVYFQGLIDVAVGEREGVPRKPAPDMLYTALAELGATADDAIYLGDSEVDIVTARNSGMPCITVLWGFRDEEFLRQQGATLLARTPADILDILEEENV